MKLVFLDLDNTLIDAGYRLNVSENKVRALVQQLADKDIRIGLCSDSACITLQQWANRLGLTGPIIGERGAVVWNSKLQIENILNVQETAWFRDLRESFVGAAMRNFPDATILIGDATRFVKEWSSTPTLTRQVFAVNGFRVASFSFFACRFKKDQSTLEPDPKLLERASALVERIAAIYGKRKEHLYWDENSQHGILIVHSAITEKRRAVATLIEELKPEQTFMVGDGMSDFLDLPQVKQYAVNNADPRYKAKSDFVAQTSLTSGVIECLKRCI